MKIMRIREEREREGLLQVDLALLMGVKRMEIEDWENEIYLPRTRQLPLLASVLGCSINDLFVSGKEE